MELVLINKELRDRVVIKPGFDWVSFFSFYLFGIPHLFRRQYDLFITLVLMNIIFSFSPLNVEYVAKNPSFDNLAYNSFIVLCLIFSSYIGFFGKKIYCKHLLIKGYIFEDENSSIALDYKKKWGIL